jgi:hypothetical protein
MRKPAKKHGVLHFCRGVNMTELLTLLNVASPLYSVQNVYGAEGNTEKKYGQTSNMRCSQIHDAKVNASDIQFDCYSISETWREPRLKVHWTQNNSELQLRH